MSQDTFKAYTIEEVEDLHGEELVAVMLDKRQPDEVRLAAMQKHPNHEAFAVIVQDMDNSPEVREAATDSLNLQYGVNVARATDSDDIAD